jgi:4-amino-4-deoxy-L-arabinose transferase-like glycosyltransferase
MPKSFRDRLEERRWILLFGITLFLGRMFEADFQGDGIYYAALSKGVLSAENPLILGFSGDVYLNKPPLFFWLNALVMKLIGPTPYAAVLVSGVSAIGVMLLLYALTLRLWNDENTGTVAAFVFATNYIVYRNTVTCRPESLLALTILAALYVIVVYLKRPGRLLALAFGLFCGLATLTKGAPGILAFLVGVAFIVWKSRTDRQAASLGDAGLATLVFLLSCGWWYAYIIQHSDFWSVFVQGQVLDRIGQSNTHYEADPIHAHALHLLRHYFYYLPFAAYGIYRVLRTGRPAPETILLLAFLIPYFLSVHFLATKYSRYLYPVVMLLSPFVAHGICSLWKIAAQRWLARLTVAAMVFLIIYPFGLFREDFRFLDTVERMAASSGIEVVVDRQSYAEGVTRPGIYFFLDEFELEPATSGSYFFVTHRELDRADMRLLFESRQVRVYLAERG